MQSKVSALIAVPARFTCSAVPAANTINDRDWATGAANSTGNTASPATRWASGLDFEVGTLAGTNSVAPVNDNFGKIAGLSESSTQGPQGRSFSCPAFFSADGYSCRLSTWQNGTISELPTFGGNFGIASGVNDKGQVVGWSANQAYERQVLPFEAVLNGREPNDITELAPFAGDLDGAGWNTPTAIDDRDQVAGFSDLPGDVVDGVPTPNFHPFLWTREGGTADLGTLPGDNISEATDINDKGQILGVSYPSSHVFMWQHRQTTNLNSLVQSGTLLELISAGGINESGEIAGQACVLGIGVCSADTFAFLAIPKTIN